MPDFTPFWISLKVAVISTIIVMILSIIIARLLYRGTGHFTKLLESLILLPIVLPPTVMGFILLIIFSPRGFVGQFFQNVLHLPVVFTMTGAVIASVIVSFPLMYQHTVQGFRNIEPKMLNTARTMGASENKIFFKLILPLSKRAILAGIMMSFARAIGEFGATLMLAGYIPNKTNTLPLEIYFLVEQSRENEAWLWVLVLVAFSIAVIGTLNFANRDKYREVD
ncbi:molybdate ABC transporter permease subunit [Staphylococcus lugdunensis]|jgi:molybdate transport system permease protein|uniref:Molybdenum transport system permease n=1 Tax=Staphylococcus lugdunensis TaxID=28035 RepID=A0A133Q4S4_STALU|nr:MULTISPECIES: molybdate ABC transporter permease subunit [Staphylococcus]ADC86895.1 Molybdenum transport system permease protein ModB [Staphylococcus lugdunensis HKU09-01]AMG62324.1 molybdenum ABC transporter permease [Staphylococcus lugdunensis]AMG63752.1 molybdate ABC transporter permease subunit [Staphylococcus lugdunensis]ARB77178.1 molybdate ABC transporter permease subunit [Staphylococcus lugdunensis]ARJ08630.1 molybdenum ABC transporter permease subunit [Staphylococcus lugdunensis]